MKTQIQEMSDASALKAAALTGSDWLLYIETGSLELKAVSPVGVAYRLDTSGAVAVFITP